MNQCKWWAALVGLLLLPGVLATLGCRKHDKYLPSIDNGDDSYRFSKEQLEEMAKNPLNQRLFLRYLEAKWPLDKLKTYCTTHEPMPPEEQNLVGEKCFDECPLYQRG